jgi:hypothetical protein
MSIQPAPWVETPRDAVVFYEAAFGVTVLHRVGEGTTVAQLGAGDAAFWVAAASAVMKRLTPLAIDGPTSRTLRRFAAFAPSTRRPRDPHQARLPSLASATIRGPTTRASGIGPLGSGGSSPA